MTTTDSPRALPEGTPKHHHPPRFGPTAAENPARRFDLEAIPWRVCARKPRPGSPYPRASIRSASRGRRRRERPGRRWFARVWAVRRELPLGEVLPTSLEAAYPGESTGWGLSRGPRWTGGRGPGPSPVRGYPAEVPCWSSRASCRVKVGDDGARSRTDRMSRFSTSSTTAYNIYYVKYHEMMQHTPPVTSLSVPIPPLPRKRWPETSVSQIA